MRYTLLLIALLIAGCSSPTEVEEEEPQFEPVQIGNWLMVSEEKAEYTGVKGKFKADSTAIDTVDITTPEGIHMDMEDIGEYRYFNVIITDSTITGLDQYSSQIYFGGDVTYTNSIKVQVEPHHYSNLDHTVLTARVRIACDEPYLEPQEFIYVQWHDKNEENWRVTPPELVYRVDVDGFYETGYELACL